MQGRIQKIQDKLLEATPLILQQDHYRRAGIMIPLMAVEGELSLIYQVRSAHIRQGGEVSFPGGMCEPKDEDNLEKTAIRECCEELGIRENEIQVIGKVGTMIQLSGLWIEVYVGLIEERPLKAFKCSNEVEELFSIPYDWLEQYEPRSIAMDIGVKPRFYEGEEEVPMESLMLPERYQEGWSNILRQLYFYHYKHYMIWGLTAEITLDFMKKTSL